MQECCLWIAFLGAKMVQILNKNIGKSTWVKAAGTIPCPWSWMPQAIGISNIFSWWGSIPSWDGDTFPPPSSWGESHSSLKLGDFPLSFNSHVTLSFLSPAFHSSSSFLSWVRGIFNNSGLHCFSVWLQGILFLTSAKVFPDLLFPFYDFPAVFLK